MKSAVIGLVAIAAGFAGVALFTGGTAETPSVFEGTATLTTALEQSAEDGRPVVAVATADWCGPCQRLKADTLSDPAVAGLLASRAIPVYLEDGSDREAISRLGVTAYPTTLVISDGAVVDQIAGYRPPADYLAFLNGAIPAAD